MTGKKIAASGQLQQLQNHVSDCCLCPRLVEWRERIAAEPRRAYVAEKYWARPVPGWGDPEARLLILGLAPAAHGGNRTGRIFTGDRSGDWLHRALHRFGFASQSKSTARNDGLRLRDAYVTAVVRCAPPANKPTSLERNTCLPYLTEEIRLLRNLKVIVTLGRFAWDGLHRALHTRPEVAFSHGAESRAGRHTVIASYHPSQQNTFTGRLTESMLDHVFAEAQRLIDHVT